MSLKLINILVKRFLAWSLFCNDEQAIRDYRWKDIKNDYIMYNDIMYR